MAFDRLSNFEMSLDYPLQKITSLSQHIQQAPDLDAAMGTAVCATRNILNSDRVLVYQFLPKGDGVVLTESIAAGWQPIQGQLIYDPCFQTRWHLLYQQGKVSVMNDVEAECSNDCYQALLHRLQVRANLVVAIVTGQAGELPASLHLWGLLIAHQCHAPRQWQPLDIQVMQHVAMQLGITVRHLEHSSIRRHVPRSLHAAALHHTIGYTPDAQSDIQSDTQGLAAILEIQQAIARQCLGLDDVMALIADGTQDLTHGDGVVIAMVDGEDLVYRAATGIAAPWVGVHLNNANSLSGWCMTTGELIHCTNTETDPRVGLPACHYLGVRSLVSVPLQYQGDRVGMVTVLSSHTDGFTPHDVQTVQLMAGFLTGSIQVTSEFAAKNTLLVALKKNEEMLLYQTQQERMIYNIAQNLRQSLNLDYILNTTVTEVRHFLQTDRVVIYRFNPDWSGIVVTESVAPGWNSILNMEILDTYLVEHHDQVYTDRTVQARNDIDTAGLSPCHIQLLQTLQVKAKLVVPIWLGDALWGLLVAHQCSTPRHWQSLESELLLQLASQVAIAIQQSDLYRQVQHLNTHLELQVQERTAQLQQSLEFEALLKRITDSVRDSLDEQQILQSAVQELAQGLNTICCDAGIYSAEQTISTIAHEVTSTLPSAQGQRFAIAIAPYPDVYQDLLHGQVCQFCGVIPNPFRPEQQLLTTLACPMVDDQGVLGDLWLSKPSETVFDEPEVRLVQQVANQCAIALRQSRLYHAAQAQVEELARLNQLKDDFLSTVSHELRTPIASIKMAIQMLDICLRPLGVFEQESGNAHLYFQILQSECDRQISLINDLLDLTRIDAETERLDVSPIHLQFWIPHVVELFIQSTNRQQQTLEVFIPPDLPPLTTEMSYLERALTELLHNAFKYTPSGETIRVSAQLETSNGISSSLLICVSNSGVEIPDTERDRIFEKFYRIPNRDPWKHGGTGLGLALVKKLVGQMAGSIYVKSENHMTQFIMQFPLVLS